MYPRFLAYTVFEYDPKIDSVLRVTKEGYESCNKAKPIEKYKEGMTKIELNHSGPFHFIGGSEGKCNERGQKLIVVVLSNGEHSLHTSITNRSLELAPANSPNPGYAHGLSAGFMTVVMGIGTLVVMVLL